MRRLRVYRRRRRRALASLFAARVAAGLRVLIRRARRLALAPWRCSRAVRVRRAVRLRPVLRLAISLSP
jgi:hypothetical protein